MAYVQLVSANNSQNAKLPRSRQTTLPHMECGFVIQPCIWGGGAIITGTMQWAQQRLTIKQLRSKRKHRQLKALPAFTIIELLIVIVIIAILAAITIVAYNGVIAQATVTMLKSDLVQGNTWLGAYQASNGSYPISQAVAVADGLKASPGDTMTYYATPNGASYCLQATSANNSTVSYGTTPGGGQPTTGGCLEAGLVGWWPLNGTANDTTPNGNNGSPGAGVSWVSGTNGFEAARFDGSSTANIIVGNKPVFDQPNLTFSAWIDPSALPTGSGSGEIISKEASYKYRLVSNGIGVLVGSTATGWTFNQNAPYSFSPGTWYNVVMTCDSANDKLTIYINGSVALTGTIAPITAYSSNQLVIGSYGGGGAENFDGLIQDARMYSRVLSASEVQALYTAGAQ